MMDGWMGGREGWMDGLEEMMVDTRPSLEEMMVDTRSSSAQGSTLLSKTLHDLPNLCTVQFCAKFCPTVCFFQFAEESVHKQQM